MIKIILLKQQVLGQIYEYYEKESEQFSYILILQEVNNDINCLKLLTACLGIFKNAYIYANQYTVGLVQEFAQDIDSTIECFQLDENSYNALFNKENQDTQSIQQQNSRRIYCSMKEFKGYFDVLATDLNIKNIYYKLQLQICANLLNFRIDELKARIKQSPLTKQQFQVYKNRILAEQFAEFHKENIEGNIQIIERFQKSLSEVKEYNTLLTNSKCSHLILKEFQFFENKKDQYQEYEEFEEDIDIFYQFYMENCPNYSNKKLIILEFLTKVLKEGAKDFIEKNIQQSKYLPLPAQISNMTNTLAQEKEVYYESLMCQAQEQIEQLQNDIMSNRLLYEKNLEQVKEITSLEINELEEKIRLLETSSRKKDGYLRDSLNKHDKDKMLLEQKVHFQDIEIMELRKKVHSQISFNQFLNENKFTQTEEISYPKIQKNEDIFNLSIPSQNSQIPQRENRDELEGFCEMQHQENSEQNIIFNSEEKKSNTQSNVEKLLKEVSDLTEYIAQRDAYLNNLLLENTNLQNEISYLKDLTRVRNTQVTTSCENLLFQNFEEQKSMQYNIQSNEQMITPLKTQDQQISRQQYSNLNANQPQFGSKEYQQNTDELIDAEEELRQIADQSNIHTPELSSFRHRQKSENLNCSDQNISEYNNKIISLEQHISELNQLIEKLKFEMQEQSDEIIMQQEKIQFLNEQQNNYEHKQKEYEHKQKENENKQQEYEYKQYEYEQKQIEYESKQQEYERKIELINESNAQNLQKECSNLNQIISLKDKQYSECLNSLKQQQTEFDNLKQQFSTNDSRQQENNKKLQEQQEIIKQQEENIKEKSEQLYQIFQQNSRLSNENISVQQELLTQIQQKDELKHIFEVYKNKINQIDQLEGQIVEQNQYIEQQDRALFEQQEHFSGQVQQIQAEVNARYEQAIIEKDEQIMNLNEELQQSIQIIQQLQNTLYQIQDEREQLQENDKIQTTNIQAKDQNQNNKNQQQRQHNQPEQQKCSSSDFINDNMNNNPNGQSLEKNSMIKNSEEQSQSRKESNQASNIFERENQRYENNRKNIEEQKKNINLSNNIEEVEGDSESQLDRYSLPVQTSNQQVNSNNDSNSIYKKDQKHEFSIMKLKDSYENGRSYSDQSTSQFKQQSGLYNPQKELSFQDNNDDLFISPNAYNQGLNIYKNSQINTNQGATKAKVNQNTVLEENQDNSLQEIQDNSEKNNQTQEEKVNIGLERDNNKKTQNDKQQFQQVFNNQNNHNEYRLNNNVPYFNRQSSNRSSSNSINYNKENQQINTPSQEQDTQQLQSFKKTNNGNGSRYQLDFNTENSNINHAQGITTTAPCIISASDNEKMEFQENIFKCYGQKRDYLTVPTDHSLTSIKSFNNHQAGMRQIQDQRNHNQSIKPIKQESTLHRVSSQNAQDFFQENLFEQIKHQKSDSYHPSPIHPSKNRRLSSNSNLGIPSLHEFDLKVVQSINEIPSPTYIAQKLLFPLIGQSSSSSDVNKQNNLQQINTSHSHQNLVNLQQQNGMRFDVNDLFEDIFPQNQNKTINRDILNKENKNVSNILLRKIQDKKKESNSLLQFENDLKILEENILGQSSQNSFKNKFDINSLFNQKPETTQNNRKKHVSIGIFDSLQKKDYLGKNTLNTESTRNQDQKNNKFIYGAQSNINNNQSQIQLTKVNSISNKILENKFQLNLDSLSTQTNNTSNFNTSRNATPLNDRKSSFFQSVLGGYDDKQNNHNNIKNNNKSYNNMNICSPNTKSTQSKSIINQNAQPLLKEISTTNYQSNLNKNQSNNYLSISPLSVKNQASRTFLKSNLGDLSNKKQQTSFVSNFNLKI